MSECICGRPDCPWPAIHDHVEQQLAADLREQLGREAFGYKEAK